MKEDKVASHHDTLTSMRCEKIDFIHCLLDDVMCKL